MNEIKTAKEALKAVKKDGCALKQIPLQYQTEKVCLVAVEGSYHALQFVKNKTEAICLAAVKKDGWALEHVQDQTDEICLAAVEQNGWALQYVKNQTKEICLAAVRQIVASEIKNAMRYIRDPEMFKKIQHQIGETK